MIEEIQWPLWQKLEIWYDIYTQYPGKHAPTLHAMQGRFSSVLNVNMNLDLQCDKTYLSRFHLPHFPPNQPLFNLSTFSLPFSAIFSAI